MIYLNESGVDQLFSHPLNTYEFKKRYAIYEDCADMLSPMPDNVAGISKYKTILNAMESRNCSSLIFNRSFALGDVLMVMAVVNYINANFDDIKCSMLTDFTRFSYLKPLLPKVSEDYLIMDLDSFFELDHASNSDFYKYHRIEMIFKFLLNKKMKNFTYSLGETFVEPDSYLGKNDYLPNKRTVKIAIQTGGSAGIKTLNPTILNYCISQLQKDYTVFTFGEEKDGTPYNGIHLQNLDFWQYWSVIRDVDMVICFDSSPLWVSHFTKTPVILLHGPTAVQQRLSQHPYFPYGTASIDLAKLAKCRPCYEKEDLCSGSKWCMNQLNSIQLYEQLEEAVKKLINYKL